MATEDQITALRSKIGEPIPAGGSETDTLFTDDQVGQWVDSTLSMAYAAIQGWEAKLAYWANLVNVVDGAAARNMSDLMDHAEYMISYFTKQTILGTRGRPRIGSIIRS